MKLKQQWLNNQMRLASEALQQRLNNERRQFSWLQQELLRNPLQQRLKQQQQQLRSDITIIQSSMKHLLKQQQQQWQQAITRLDDLSPLTVLKRGFAIVHDQQGSVLHRSKQVAEGDQLKITLEQGSIAARVESITSEE